MRHQAVAVDEKLIALGFAAEDRMIVDDQTVLPFACQLLEDQRSGQTADAASDDYTVAGLSRVDNVRGESFEFAVPNAVPGLHHSHRVAVGCRVVANAPVASPLILGRARACLLRQQFRG